MSRRLRKYDRIFGVKVDSTTVALVLKNLTFSLKKFDKNSRQKPILITTPNPEQLVLAQKDPVFAKILNLADISVPDGIGLFAAKRFLSLPRPKNFLTRTFTLFVQALGVGFSTVFDKNWLLEGGEVVRGRGLFLDLVSLASKNGWRVFLLGDRSRSGQKAAKELRTANKVGQASLINPELRIYSESGPDLDEDANPETKEDEGVEEKVIQKINKVKPHFLFVGFGAPKQEKWVYRHLNKLQTNVIMVVGGTFDYVSGKKPIPPKWIENMGLEWLWRLSTGDQKWSRIKVAVLEFPLKIFFKKLFGFSRQL